MIPGFSWPRTLLAAIPWVAVAFLVGVLAHTVQPFERFSVVVIATTVGMAVGVVVLAPAYTRLAACAIALGFVFGILRFEMTIPTLSPSLPLQGVVTGVGRYDVRIRDVITDVGVTVNTTSLRMGERIQLECGEFRPLQTDDARASFQARRGSWFTCVRPSIKRLPVLSVWNPQRLLLEWRQTLTWRIQRLLPGDAGALLSGILYGERGLSPEAAATFRAAGMTHLIAVSGSNIALVVSLFVPFFLLLGYRRSAAILLSGAAIMGFVIFVGAEASVVRAAVMGWLALLARVFGRRASAGRLLVIAATAIVACDPWALAFDAGFALSFLATWGLLSWAQPLQERLKWMPEWFGLREGCATTVAATIVTTPYSLWAFGDVSLAGLLTNLVAIPLVGLAMLWGAIALVAGSVAPWLAMPAQGTLQAILLISHLAHYVPWLQVSFRVPTIGLFVVYAWLWWRTVKRRSVDRSYPQPDSFEVNVGGFFRSSVGTS